MPDSLLAGQASPNASAMIIYVARKFNVAKVLALELDWRRIGKLFRASKKTLRGRKKTGSVSIELSPQFFQ